MMDSTLPITLPISVGDNGRGAFRTTTLLVGDGASTGSLTVPRVPLERDALSTLLLGSHGGQQEEDAAAPGDDRDGEPITSVGSSSSVSSSRTDSLSQPDACPPVPFEQPRLRAAGGSGGGAIGGGANGGGAIGGGGSGGGGSGGGAIGGGGSGGGGSGIPQAVSFSEW